MKHFFLVNYCYQVNANSNQIVRMIISHFYIVNILVIKKLVSKNRIIGGLKFCVHLYYSLLLDLFEEKSYVPARQFTFVP